MANSDKMTFKEFVAASGLTQTAIADILGVRPGAISNRVNNENSEPSYSEIRRVENATGKQIYFNENILNNPEYDQVAIKYLKIPGIDEEVLKSPYIKERLQFDRELVENAWRQNPKNLRILQMRSDKMHGGGYPLKGGHILIVDISLTDVANSGIFIYTTEVNNKMEVFVSNINKYPDSSLRFYYTNPKYSEIIYSAEELKKMKFKVWGRIVKNLSLTLYG